MTDTTQVTTPAPKLLRPLNIRERLFVDWYIKLGGQRFGAQAAVKAGYSEKTAKVQASQLLTRPNVQAYIEKRMKQTEELLGINKNTIIQDLLLIKQKSSQAIPVMIYNPKTHSYEQKMEEDENGVKVGVYQYDSNGANRALEQVSKMLGYNEPEKIKHSNDPDNPINTVIYIPTDTRDKSEEQTQPTK